MLTEKRAWLCLAKEWKEVIKSDAGYEWIFWGRGSRGLCQSIHNIFNHGAINSVVHKSMLKSLRDYKIKYNIKELYFWSTTNREGKRSRVKFCVEQAKKCK
jgi:hypothetical protein